MEKRTFLSEGYAGQANHLKEREALDRRYRKIGISAVAAAVRYQGEAKVSGISEQGAGARLSLRVRRQPSEIRDYF